MENLMKGTLLRLLKFCQMQLVSNLICIKCKIKDDRALWLNVETLL